MRSAVALLIASCAGGQTGEITMATACDEVVERTEGAPEAQREALLALAWSGPIAWRWEDGDETRASLAVTPRTGDAVRLGGAGCEVSWWELPVTVAVTTDDGELADELPGTATLTGDTGSVLATTSYGALRGDDSCERAG